MMLIAITFRCAACQLSRVRERSLKGRQDIKLTAKLEKCKRQCSAQCVMPSRFGPPCQSLRDRLESRRPLEQSSAPLLFYTVVGSQGEIMFPGSLKRVPRLDAELGALQLHYLCCSPNMLYPSFVRPPNDTEYVPEHLPPSRPNLNSQGLADRPSLASIHRAWRHN